MGIRVRALALALAAAAACGPVRAAPGQAGAAGLPVSESCADAARLARGHEYQGLTSPAGMPLRALVESDTVSAGQHTTRIRWRVGGHGAPRIVATLASGRTVLPDQAPVRRPPSDATQPGADEWATSWRLPAGGCWTFSLTRDDLSGTLALRV